MVFRSALPCVLAGVLLMIAATTQVSVEARQHAQQDERGRIRSEVNLVGTLASVLDKDGRPALDSRRISSRSMKKASSKR